MEKQINEKLAYQKTLLENRLQKQYRQLKKWARKNQISSYRLYDRDIPEIPLCLDLYTFTSPSVKNKEEALEEFLNEARILSENSPSAKDVLKDIEDRTYIHMNLYQRPYEKDQAEENIWLDAMAEAVAQAVGIKKEHVIVKTRKKQSETEEGHGHRDQYEKINSSSTLTGYVFEQGQLFKVNLTDYIDTGLFFDHRPLRKLVRESCKDKSILNLFCYTASFSVYSAEGNAKCVESVDMSKTYIEWGKENFQLNGFDLDDIYINKSKTKSFPKYTFTRQDAIGFLNQKNAEVANEDRTNRYDIIILDPPTFSNSKRTDNTLDINRDWPELVKKCLSILNPEGILYFSTNSKRLSFSEQLLPVKEDGSPLCHVEDITDITIPQDYRNQKIHRAWKITLNN